MTDSSLWQLILKHGSVGRGVRKEMIQEGRMLKMGIWKEELFEVDNVF